MLPFQLTRFKAFVLIILFSLLAVACASNYEKETDFHGATSDRSGRLSSSRASARDSSSHGAHSTSGAHGAAAANRENEHGGAAVHWAYD